MLRKTFTKIPTSFNILYIRFNSNNIIATITNNINKVLITSSSGNFGFKGHKKITTTALYKVLNSILSDNLIKKTTYIMIRIFGSNTSRLGLLRFLSNLRYKIVSFEEYFSFPHNGCRPKKRRKV